MRNRRRAFTLVEILCVIALIGFLGAMVLSIAGHVYTSRNSARARAEIQMFGVAIESFKRTYGEYPLHNGGANDDEGWRRSFYACLSGLKVLKVKENQIQLVNYENASDDPSKTPVRRAFLSDAQINTNRDAKGEAPNENERYYVDPWENPYGYRYSPLSGGSVGRQWERPGYLLVCAGEKHRDPIANTDYFVGSMETTGVVPNDYFDDEYRADNITNWRLE
ncbi:MAG: type II secretion system GspH family protein [Puniceicoccales bacterium]|jgi:prepilin-type N-terminal cleavage/methylation domain-containing protein|nr:type II secretion system GspH family protein [Puniceicoccales bacterium]